MCKRISFSWLGTAVAIVPGVHGNIGRCTRCGKVEREPAITLRTETRAEMPGLAGNYIRFCSEHLGQLQQCITRQDARAVSRIADALSGNAGKIGLSQLASLGRELGEYCVGGDWGAIDSTYRAIADTVSKLCDGEPVRIHVRPHGDRREQRCVVRKTG